VSLAEEIEFWRTEAQIAKRREIAFFALGVQAGLRYACDDHADEIIEKRRDDLSR